MGNRLETQLWEQDLNHLGPPLTEALHQCRKGNPKLNWLKVVTAISGRILPLCVEAHGRLMAEKPPPPAPAVTAKKWQKRLDQIQVVLHTAGAVLTHLGHLPPSVLTAPGFEAALKTSLIPSLLRHALQDRGGWVTLDLAAVVQQLPVAHETLAGFLVAWGKYLEDLTLAHSPPPNHPKDHLASRRPSDGDAVGLCRQAVEATVAISEDWPELDSLWAIMLDTEQRPTCMLFILDGLLRCLSASRDRFANTCGDALAAVIIGIIRNSLRVPDRSDLCDRGLACLLALAPGLSDGGGLLLCSTRIFAAPDDCWAEKEGILRCLAAYLQAHPHPTPPSLAPTLVKALQAADPHLACASVWTTTPPVPAPGARSAPLNAACSALECIAAAAADPQVADLLPAVTRGALFYPDPSLPTVLRCLASLLQAHPAQETPFARCVTEGVADAVRFPPPASAALAAPLRGGIDRLIRSATPSAPVFGELSGAPTGDPWLTALSLDFYIWREDGFQATLPASIAARCPGDLATEVQTLLAVAPVKDHLRRLARRVAACIGVRVSATDDPAQAEESVVKFLQILQTPLPDRPWVVADAAFTLRFGMQVCADFAVQVVTGQRDSYVSGLKADVARLEAAVQQLAAEKAAAVAKLGALHQRSARALQLSQALQCSVCLETLTENRPCALPCGHLFHNHLRSAALPGWASVLSPVPHYHHCPSLDAERPRSLLACLHMWPVLPLTL